ncbi:hypothetical protein CL97_gp101 [Cronobacter phage CR9]|uniref:Uncharacterized protein n=1 Tax=Cronobacter phage CR9 TaxID=1162290 RepID=M1F3J7_9CAUD|nr:hypothetical protein CL97_gp101 [Cronobacter phage CR9]AFH20985.1 hypothetical protein CR9_101 [Cronobacter phage CR9]
MTKRYSPRSDIQEYLTTEAPGVFPPTHLHLKKPEYDATGKYTAKAGETVVYLPKLFEEMGLSNVKIPMNLFFEICEHTLQFYEVSNGK